MGFFYFSDLVDIRPYLTLLGVDVDVLQGAMPGVRAHPILHLFKPSRKSWTVWPWRVWRSAAADIRTLSSGACSRFITSPGVLVFLSHLLVCSQHVITIKFLGNFKKVSVGVNTCGSVASIIFTKFFVSSRGWRCNVSCGEPQEVQKQ